MILPELNDFKSKGYKITRFRKGIMSVEFKSFNQSKFVAFCFLIEGVYDSTILEGNETSLMTSLGHKRTY